MQKAREEGRAVIGLGSKNTWRRLMQCSVVLNVRSRYLRATCKVLNVMEINNHVRARVKFKSRKIRKFSFRSVFSIYCISLTGKDVSTDKFYGVSNLSFFLLLLLLLFSSFFSLNPSSKIRVVSNCVCMQLDMWELIKRGEKLIIFLSGCYPHPRIVNDIIIVCILFVSIWLYLLTSG